ncbi:MAG: CRTAC1 family protein [Deinococcota bacterium]
MSLSITLLCLNISFGQTVPSFTEETQQANIQHVYEGGFEHLTGGGLAVFDCNGDDLPELYMAGGESLSSFYLNTGQQADNLQFEKIDRLAMTGVTGAYPLDVNADNLIDLIVLRVGRNSLFQGLGDCQFTEANDLWEFDGGDDWSTAFSATWLPNDTWPTLAVGNYIDQYQDESPFGTCLAHQLFRPNSDAFEVQRLTPAYCALSMLFTDWNRSGTPSLRISNDRQYYLTNQNRRGSEQLFYFDGQNYLPYEGEQGWTSLQIWGMGIASAELTGDGYPEYVLTSMSDTKLRTLAEIDTETSTWTTPTYQDSAFARGVTAHIAYTGDTGKPSTGWHAEFDDLNNDSLSDLFIAKGNVDAMSDFALDDPNNLLLQQPDGAFTEVGLQAGIASGERGRGAAVVDLNLDGKLDIVVVNRNANAQVWRNTSQDLGNWLQVRLEHPHNSHGIGSWLELDTGERTFYKELTIGGGHVSGELGFTHMGLGPAQTARLKVHWFDGQVSDWHVLMANQIYHIHADGKIEFQ